MQKKHFISLVLGVMGGLMFAIGMCMCLLPEWNAFTPGVVVTAVGALLLAVLGFALWKTSGKPAPRPDWKFIGKVAFGVMGALVMGVGMCMILVWELMIPGIIVGVLGIFLLLCLIPMFTGLK